MSQEHRYTDPQAMADALATDVSARLSSAIQKRGHAFLAVSGGRSPIAFLEALSRERLAWAEVTVILVDERCVTEQHPDSNTALIRQHLLQGPAFAACFMPFFQTLPAVLDDSALDTLQSQAETRLARLSWPLDVAVLGMGPDGHTASLFPHAAGLDKALSTRSFCAWVRPHRVAHPRLTLSLSALLGARHLALPIQGDEKLAVYQHALQLRSPDLPVSMVLHQQDAPITTWICA